MKKKVCCIFVLIEFLNVFTFPYSYCCDVFDASLNTITLFAFLRKLENYQCIIHHRVFQDSS